MNTIFDDNNLIQQYLLFSSDDMRLNNSPKPILWLYVPHHYNSRYWLSFGSRSSHNLNQPYIYLCVKSIIEKCNKSFNICIIDEYSFSKLLPTWEIDMEKIPFPIKRYLIDLALTKLLYKYGGMRVPISFVCFRDLISLYYKGIENNNPFLCSFVDRNISSTYIDVFPSIEFMGSTRNNNTIAHLIEFMQQTISNDFTDEIQFLGQFNRWCNLNQHKFNVIDGKLIGKKTIDNKQILIDHLLSEENIKLDKNAYGIYIPQREVMTRLNYNWFVRMSPQQVLEGNMVISKYLLLANVPYVDFSIVENMKNKNNNWIDFWQVPSAAPVWGMKPINLGHFVKKENYPENVPGP